MGSLSVWGNIQGFTVTEYVRSCDSGIFRRWWAKVVSPYSWIHGNLSFDASLLLLREVAGMGVDEGPGWA